MKSGALIMLCIALPIIKIILLGFRGSVQIYPRNVVVKF